MMRTKNALRLSALILALPVLWACNNTGSTEGKIVFTTKGEPLAKVGKSLVTEENLIAKIRPNKDMAERFNSSLEEKKRVLETEVSREIIFQEALRQGFLNREEVQTQIKKLLVQSWLKDEQNRAPKKFQISDEEKKAYYDQHPDMFHQPEKVRADYIFLPFGEDKAAAQKKAKALHARVLQETKTNTFATFAKIADEFAPRLDKAQTAAEKPKRRNGLRTKEQTEQEFGKKASDALWAMGEPKRVSGLIEGDQGYYIFNALGSKAIVDRTYDAAKEYIDQRITMEKHKEAFTKRIEELKKAFPVTVFEERLSKLGVGPKTQDNAPTHTVLQ